VNCPKCGYAQDNRLDCVKCGIVFSKYAQHLTDRVARQDSPAPQLRAVPPLPPLPHTGNEEMQQVGLAELRQSVRELSRRFSEVEFERAERNQIRAELRGLDQKVRDALSQIGARVADCEAAVSAMPDSAQDPPLELIREQLWEEDLQPLLDKIDRLDTTIEKLQQEPPAPKPDPRLMEAILKLEARITEMDGRISVRDTAANGTVDNALREFSELKTAVQSATVRYSEIGDLKKNALILQNALESLKLAFDTHKKEPLNGGTAKINELQTEVLALRAEVRQSFKQMAALESPGATAADLRALSEDVAALKANRGNDKTSALTARIQKLEDGLRSCSETLSSVQKSLNDLGLAATAIIDRAGNLEAESVRLGSRLTGLEQRITTLEKPCEVLRPPVEDDIHSIRDSLDQIRSFMNTLARRL
jgi:chromosome segregation ATPase